MSLNEKQIEDISKFIFTVTVMNNLGESKSEKITPHFFVDRYKKNLNQLSFMLSSLRTTLGSFWERVAEELALRNGYEVLLKSEFQQASKLHEDTNDLIEKYTNERLKAQGNAEDFDLSKLRDELDEIYEDKREDGKTQKWDSGDGIDLYFKKDDKILIFDVKTVTVNAGNGNKFDSQLIKWLCHLKHQLGNTVCARDIVVGYVFPYNSSNKEYETSHSEWMNDQGSKAQPMTEKEIFAGNKFWKLISDTCNPLESIFKGVDAALEDGSIVKKYLDKYMIEEIMPPERLDELAQEATKAFATELFGVEYLDNDEGKQMDKDRWRHRLADDRWCEFTKSINTICEKKKNGSKRVGLKVFTYKMTKCPECNHPFDAQEKLKSKLGECGG